MIKHLRNGIVVKSSIKRFTEFTNYNLSRRLVELTLLFLMMLKFTSFPLTVLNCTSNGWIHFSLQSPQFTAACSLKSEKDWPVDFA